MAQQGFGGGTLAERPDRVDHVRDRLVRSDALLPRADYARLRPHLEYTALKYRQSLYRAYRPIGFVYFIETGVGSLVNTMANGDAAEVGTIGNEGVVGLPLIFQDEKSSTSVYIQVPGTGLSRLVRKSPDGSARPAMPSSCSSKQPTSSVAP